MKLVSYSQNCEDVMLWRALGHIENGFYVDVGANDPIIDSVTKLFYDRGWRGINVEPLPSHFADLQLARPRDINVQCAASDEAGIFKIWESATRGWATLDPEVVARHERNGHSGAWISTEVRTLNEIFRGVIPANIHFLKIDVEGAEFKVLRGIDLKCVRPWIILIESVEPNSLMESYEDCDALLQGAGYRCVYEDGLNRFYLAEEREDLQRHFKFPPNLFDAYVTDQVVQLQQTLTESLERIEGARTEVELLEQRLQEMHASLSWRATAPIRRVTRAFLRALGRS